MSKFKIIKSLDVNGVTSKLKSGIELYGNTAAKQLEASAKTNAPWTDRTTNARNSIQSNFNWKGKKAVIEVSGNVDYFVYLELANKKKNAILVPTIQKEGKSILEGYRRIFK
ncbi:MAG: HK97 gp10 family phage protein [Peptoniphilaceae bacterium]